MKIRLRKWVKVLLWAVLPPLILAAALAGWSNWVVTRSGPIYDAPADAPAKPVAIVFGAKAHEDGPSDILEDRLATGVALYRRGKVGKLLLSGDHGRKHYDEVNVMRDYVLAQGVPPEDVYLDHAGFNTYATLYRARDVFGVESALLVTNEFHLPRAVYIGQKFGLDVAGVPSDRREYKNMSRYRMREILARTKAWLQVNITRPEPKYLGEKMDIATQPGQRTWDRGK